MPTCSLPRLFALGLLVGLFPAMVGASTTVYDCRFAPGSSPLGWAVIRHDETAGVISVAASHLDADDRPTGLALRRSGDEVEIRHELHEAGQLASITTYRIDSQSGQASGSVDLYGEDGSFIRGGPLPVDGACTITSVESVPMAVQTVAAAGEVCHEDNSPTQYLDAERYCASSVLSPMAGNSYGPENLFWGPEGAAWCEGVAGNGEGETIRIETDPAVTIHALVIRNGYQKSASTFSDNGRARKIEIVAAGQRMTYTLHDTTGPQRLAFRRPIVADTVTLRILSVYPGARYADTCISSFTLDLEGF